MNPRQMQQMMRQLGMSQEDIDATQVIIKTPTKELIFENPEVQSITMQGKRTFQIIGDYKEVEARAQITISQDDIDMVSEQANVSKEDAKKALEESDGDIAQAIVKLS